MTNPIIWSIGYEHLSPGVLGAIVRDLGALLVDCRSVPWSRTPAFRQADLVHRFGERYCWRGLDLGGRSPGPKPAGLAWLQDKAEAGRRVLLLCLEAAPGDCHRHRAIALRLLPAIDIAHIYGDEVILASELERAILAGDDYTSTPLDDALAGRWGDRP